MDGKSEGGGVAAGDPVVGTGVRGLLRLEGLAVLAAALLLYARLDGGWLLFALLFLIPDISMVGYLKDPRVGAVTYNAVHTYVGPVLLETLALVTGHGVLEPIAIIWIGHIAFDRMLGFGLKYPTRFGDTHLGTLDRREGEGRPSG